MWSLHTDIWSLALIVNEIHRRLKGHVKTDKRGPVMPHQPWIPMLYIHSEYDCKNYQKVGQQSYSYTPYMGVHVHAFVIYLFFLKGEATL